jgi:hypothetical protein
MSSGRPEGTLFTLSVTGTALFPPVGPMARLYVAVPPGATVAGFLPEPGDYQGQSPTCSLTALVAVRS